MIKFFFSPRHVGGTAFLCCYYIFNNTLLWFETRPTKTSFQSHVALQALAILKNMISSDQNSFLRCVVVQLFQNIKPQQLRRDDAGIPLEDNTKLGTTGLGRPPMQDSKIAQVDSPSQVSYNASPRVVGVPLKTAFSDANSNCVSTDITMGLSMGLMVQHSGTRCSAVHSNTPSLLHTSSVINLSRSGPIGMELQSSTHPPTILCCV